MSKHPAASPLATLSPATDHAPAPALERHLERALPSGRSLLLRTDAAGEEIEIRSRRGELELKIVLTEAGPVVTLRGGRLEVESPEIAFACQNFAVRAAGEVNLSSQGAVRIAAEELHARTAQDIHLNGAYIRLNCTPDAPAPGTLPAPQADKPHEP